MKCRPCGKIADASIVDYVQEKLSAHWSPEQISEQMKIDLINKKISFSSIYNWIYKRLLEKCSVELLRRKGKSLKPKETRGKSSYIYY